MCVRVCVHGSLKLTKYHMCISNSINSSYDLQEVLPGFVVMLMVQS